MDKQFEEIIDLCEARAGLYGLLSSLYYIELTEEGIQHFAQIVPSSMQLGNPMIEKGLQKMHAYATRAHSGTRQELAVDFARSFLAAGSYEGRRPTPYESVFTSEDGLLMQDARDDVYRMLCEAHLAVRPELQIPEDHLSFECEYMGLLIEKTISALKNDEPREADDYLQVQKNFHQEHLINWIDAFCDCLEKTSRTAFYQGLSQMTRGFIHQDQAFLDESIAALTISSTT